MSFIAMNRFRVYPGREEEFLDIWRARESRLKELKGFQEFRMLQGPSNDEHTLFSSHVIWDSREDFEAWTKSEQFRASHSGEGKRKGSGTSPIMGHPNFEGFDVVMFEN